MTKVSKALHERFPEVYDEFGEPYPKFDSDCYFIPQMPADKRIAALEARVKQLEDYIATLSIG